LVDKEIDVFFIHPTGFFEKQWNSPIDKASAAYERTGSHLATQASAFSETCNVYAPFIDKQLTTHFLILTLIMVLMHLI